MNEPRDNCVESTEFIRIKVERPVVVMNNYINFIILLCKVYFGLPSVLQSTASESHCNCQNIGWIPHNSYSCNKKKRWSKYSTARGSHIEGKLPGVYPN